MSSRELQARVKDENSRRTYTWENREPQAPANDTQAPKREGRQPSVQITTFRSWEEVGHWYAELQGRQSVVTPEIRAKVAELTRGLKDNDDKIRVLYNFVSTRFHYVSLSFGIGRYQPHAADEVLANGYGDCKDKHTLLAALLRAAGYDAWSALISSFRDIDPDVPSPGQFDHVITAVPRGSSLVWLDTTAEVAPFALLLPNLRDKQALVIPNEKPASLHHVISLCRQIPPCATIRGAQATVARRASPSLRFVHAGSVFTTSWNREAWRTCTIELFADWHCVRRSAIFFHSGCPPRLYLLRRRPIRMPASTLPCSVMQSLLARNVLRNRSQPSPWTMWTTDTC